MHNDVHDNNNPNVPDGGARPPGPVGTGMSISGGRNDTIMDNTFTDNDAWGVFLVPYPDSGSAVHRRTVDFSLSATAAARSTSTGTP